MTDKELLEDAAKAAGIDGDHHVNGNNTWVFFEPKKPNWNPLTDDGDALRLAVKLRMRIATPTTDTDCAIAGCGDVRGVHANAYSEGITDIYAATRRAIVRAAADIGQKIPNIPKLKSV